MVGNTTRAVGEVFSDSCKGLGWGSLGEYPCRKVPCLLDHKFFVFGDTVNAYIAIVNRSLVLSADTKLLVNAGITKTSTYFKCLLSKSRNATTMKDIG